MGVRVMCIEVESSPQVLALNTIIKNMVTYMCIPSFFFSKWKKIQQHGARYEIAQKQYLSERISAWQILKIHIILYVCYVLFP